MSREMKDSGVEWIGKIPDDWDLDRIKNILIERKEMNKPVKTDFILSLTNDRGVIPYSEKGDIGNKSKEDLTSYKLAYPGDIVLNSMNAIIGSIGLSKYFGAVSPVYYMLRPRSDTDTVEYFNWLFQTKQFQENLKGYGNGIMELRMRISMGKLNTILIPYPNRYEQIKISHVLSEKVEEIDFILKQTKSTIEDYKLLKQSIITEAVTKGLDKNVEMKDSGVEWIGEVPKHWVIGKMKNVATLAPKCDNNHLKDDSEVSFAPMETVKNGYYIPRKTKFSNNNSSYNSFENGDIVIAKVTPCFENGNIAIMENLVNAYGFGSSELFVLRPKNEVCKEFLFYYLQNRHFINEGASTMTGTGGLKRVSSYFIKNYVVFHPSNDEQNQIVRFLDDATSKIDNLVNKKEQLLNDLELYKKSLIYEYITGKKEVE